MLLGTFEHVLDDKGRLAIPARFRSELQEGLVITRGQEHCLYVYPLSTWQTIESRINALPMGDANARNLRRAIFSAAESVELDKQGRIIISERLRSYAGLNSNVAVVGVSSHVEIWDLEKWNEVEALVEEQGEEIASHLSGQF